MNNQDNPFLQVISLLDKKVTNQDLQDLPEPQKKRLISLLEHWHKMAKPVDMWADYV